MKETLVILAAGMGSRYGGLKQVDVVGNNGESIINFTIYDAIKVGFKKVVLIIRKEHEELFEENLVKKIRPFVEVEYAYQDLNDIPEGVTIPEGRVKPWGTTHALLACRNILKEDPFVICNADDFYGRDAFRKVIDFFHDGISDNNYCMVGYKVGNTLSDHGTVTRGICSVDENGNLSGIKETSNIRRTATGAAYESDGKNIELDPSTPVSMNFWGFKPNVCGKLMEIFENEIEDGIKNNPLKYEALLPTHVGLLIKKDTTVKVLTSEDSWFGVTYQEDKPVVIAKIQEFKDNGVYPFDLWAK